MAANLGSLKRADLVVVEGLDLINKMHLSVDNKKLCREVFGSVCEQTYAPSVEDAQEEPEAELQPELSTTTVGDIQQEIVNGKDE